MTLKLIKPFLFLGLIGLLSGCYYQGPEYYDELDIVYTNYDNTFDFKSNKKYSMPNKIVKVTANVAQGSKPEYVSSSSASLIFSTIRTNMTSYGYTEVADSSLADLILFPAALEVTNTTYYYDYYGYYWGYYYPYYGWYYPYGTSTTTYQTGTLLLDLVSTKDPSPTGKGRAVWVGAVNGLLEGTTSNVNSRISKAVNQAFKQSEYLR
jgi:hypothetical protein